MIDVKTKAREIHERGYCVLESAYDEDECRRIRAIMDRLCEQRGGLSASLPYMGFNPFLQSAPEMGPFFAKPEVADLMAEALQDDVRLAHSGGCVTNEYANLFIVSWHSHYRWEIPSGGLNRENPERLFGNVYVDGSNREVGPLVAIPRHLNDPIDQPFPDPRTDWPGQVTVEVPPGSVVVFDSALWHTGKRGTRPGHRHLFGGEYQGWHNPKPHPEDNDSDSPALAPCKSELPILRRLIDGP